MPRPKKKIHWTQTPEGQAKLALRRHKPSPSGVPSDVPEAIFAYALGHVESWLTLYAQSSGVSADALTARMGQVLQRKARR